MKIKLLKKLRNRCPIYGDNHKTFILEEITPSPFEGINEILFTDLKEAKVKQRSLILKDVRRKRLNNPNLKRIV